MNEHDEKYERYERLRGEFMARDQWIRQGIAIGHKEAEVLWRSRVNTMTGIGVMVGTGLGVILAVLILELLV